ncbi:hypothetical protein DET56_107105 [Paenibacillus pabuli]|uniref:Uncharacterized protein n=1 Tax=Paenibacillus pabuli TaxID=1472 RepID=A0A855Y7V0_9BACL|nr:hypothetical protein DET56_107105 [Paenibacillus pabuli]PXW05889.1 hypothetical protein DEU73_107105 [Paenibacillus taichungensis]
MTFTTGEVLSNATIKMDPNVINTAETIKAGRVPDLSIQRPARGELMSEHKPRVSIISPV